VDMLSVEFYSRYSERTYGLIVGGLIV
jgi:hypothetical protein